MRSDTTAERAAGRRHTHYAQWFVGDGVKTEFLLSRTIQRVEDVMVTVDGLVKRPYENGTAYDYQVRGHTAGYGGEKNAIKFAVAPANTKNVGVFLIST